MLNGGGPAVESLPVPDARRVLADLQAAVPVNLSGVEESERTIESEGRTLHLNLVRPAGTGRERLPVFVFVHGGGWVLGDYLTHRRLVRDLVAESGCAAVFVNYTPSPEARFPQAVEEIYIAVKWVAENGREIGVDGSRLALAGNSVGGNMSLAAALLAKDHGGPQIRTLVLMWPVTDAGYDWDSYAEYAQEGVRSALGRLIAVAENDIPHDVGFAERKVARSVLHEIFEFSGEQVGFLLDVEVLVP